MEKEKLRLLDGMDSYLPHVDGVINCMHHYCVYGCKKADITAVAPSYKNYVDKEPYKIIRCKSFYMPIMNLQYGQATKDKKFWKEVTKKQYDIVHVHSPFNMAKFMLKVAKHQNIPAVATFHSNMRPIFRQVFKSKWIAERWVQALGKRYNKFDEVFVCSPIVGQQCRSFGYTGKITYLPYGTEIQRCENVEEKRKIANEKFGLQEDELVFIHVGRVEKLKRIDFILDSLKILKDKGVKFKFYVIGTGSDFKKMLKHKSKLGFTDEEVVFTGFVSNEDMLKYLARADMLLFPSLYDNFGLVKVEAAAYSTPACFIEGSCAGYGVTNDVNGYLSKDSVQDFSETVLKAISDRKKLKEVGQNASRDLYISWEECTDLYLKRLQEISRSFKDANKK